jgi:hypothetical protein
MGYRKWVSTNHLHRGHLYRKHKQPIRCPRCCETFKSIKERDLHIKDDERCVKRTGEEDDWNGFTPEQESQLRSRENLKGKGQDVRWRDVFKVLFPDVDDDGIPDPCKYYSFTDLDQSLIYNQISR